MIRKTLLGLLAAATLPALAQSSSFAGWTTTGDVLALPGSALLTTAATESGETPASGNSAVLWLDIENALGVSLDSDTFEGSAIATQFNAAAGTRVSLNWTLSTLGFDPAFADRAYVVIDGTLLALATSAASPLSGTFGTTFATGGTHTLGFAVLDVNDFAGLTQLQLSGLQVTAVPEPGTLAMWAAGLGLFGLLRRRRAV